MRCGFVTYTKSFELQLVTTRRPTGNSLVLFKEIVVEDRAVYESYQHQRGKEYQANLQRPPYDSVQRLKDFDLIFESK